MLDLLAAGWDEVIIVTDHGWLLLPGKLPKHPLPEHLTEVRKGRCARMVAGAHPPQGVTTLPWRFDGDVDIAVAPGIYAFRGRPRLRARGHQLPGERRTAPVGPSRPPLARGADAGLDLSWTGLTLAVTIDGLDGGHVDLRTKAADASSTLASGGKPVKKGKARLFASDDHLGVAAVVVVLGPDGEQLANRPTIVPEG